MEGSREIVRPLVSPAATSARPAPNAGLGGDSPQPPAGRRAARGPAAVRSPEQATALTGVRASDLPGACDYTAAAARKPPLRQLVLLGAWERSSSSRSAAELHRRRRWCHRPRLQRKSWCGTASLWHRKVGRETGARTARLICEWIFYPEREEGQALDHTDGGSGGFGSAGKNENLCQE